MKEFLDNLDNIFRYGLRPFEKRRRSLPQFYDLYNFKPTKFGIVRYDPIYIPISEDVRSSHGLDSEEFPFPQLLVGMQYIFICCATRIFLVDKSDWDTLYELETYDAENTSSTKDISVGNAWKLIDFWDTFFLVNGVCTVFIAAHERMLGSAVKAYVFDRTPINTGIAHKGRALFGGFDASTFWGTTWQRFWNTWYDNQKSTGLSQAVTVEGESVDMPVGKNWVWWSSIGGGDILYLFFPSLAQSGIITSGHGASDPLILRMLKKNEQGFAPMPVQGTVVNMHPLEDFVVVFTDEGVVAMKPEGSPTPRYNVKSLDLGGIASWGAVAGNKKHLVYLDKSGTLVRITSGGEIEPLGYRDYLFDMLGTDVLLSHSGNPNQLDRFGEFYISNQSSNFCLLESGLHEHGQKVTTVVYMGGTTIGLVNEIPQVAVIEGRIGIDCVAGEFGGIKTIEWVRLIGRISNETQSLAKTAYVSIDYRYNISTPDTFSNSGNKRVNNEGYVTFPVAGTDLRINIYVEDYEDLDIDTVEYGIKHGDKRYKRSVSISTAVKRSD